MTNMNIIYLCYIYVNIGGIASELFQLRTPNKRLKEHNMDELSPIGLQMCMRECSVRTLCKSLNFCRNTLTCELSSSDAETYPDDLIDDSDWEYAEKTEKPERYLKEYKSCASGTKIVNTTSGQACVVSDCPKEHPDRQITTVVVNSTSVGTVLKYQCIMFPQSSLVSTCLPNGNWTSQSDQCNPLPACFNSDTSCWVRFNFVYNSYCRYCGGTQYVKKTNYTSAPYVGIILCSSALNYYQYKIMLGSDITSTFYDIVDLSGNGQDHCELVGGRESSSNPSYCWLNSGMKVYYRNVSGQEFSFGDLNENIIYFIADRYECKVVLPFLPEPECFNTPDSCWYRYDFAFDPKWNGCPNGERYIKRTNYSSELMVGIIRCFQDRYQVYLGANKTDLFLNIGDNSGGGEGLCELVRGLQTEVVTANDSESAPTMQGYCQSEFSEEFVISEIGGNTGCKSSSWYQCGVSLPSGWYEYNISVVDNGWNGCSSGVSYVRNSTIDSMPFLAAFVCNNYGNMRFKLFGGSSLSSTFMEIFHPASEGNNCDLVYGYPYNELQSTLKYAFDSSSRLSTGVHCNGYGFYRYGTNGIFYSGCLPNTWYSWYFYLYTECGIQVP